MIQKADKRIRIFISSPGDVADERARAKQLIEGLKRRYAGQLELEAVLWEKMPLQPDTSFQEGIEAVLDGEHGIDIAVFILWARFGSPLGPKLKKRDGSPYQSGTEREYDLMVQSRRESQGKRPHILVYTRKDDSSFHERLRDKSAEEIKELSEQKLALESFVKKSFQDEQTQLNKGAYHNYCYPVDFTHALRDHLRHILDELASDVTQKTVWDIDTQGSPYRSLDAFQPEHSPVFFGREDEIESACRALQESAKDGPAFLMLLGASGSGKSSLARAGIVPAVMEYEWTEQVAHWRCMIVTPSELVVDPSKPDPIECFVRRFAADDSTADGTNRTMKVLPELTSMNNVFSVESITASLRKDPVLTIENVFVPAFEHASIRENGPVRWLLLVDQLEELFSSPTISVSDRNTILTIVKSLAETRRVWVLMTARSDFYQQFQGERALMDLKMSNGQLDVLPPGVDALRRIVELPAKLSGLKFQEWNVAGDRRSLAEEILKDAAGHAELLPLIEFVLNKLFEKRTEDGVLTREAFNAIGGSVEGALARNADDVFDKLDGRAKDSLSDVLRSFVTVVRDREGITDDKMSQDNRDEKIVRLHANLNAFPVGSPHRDLINAFVAERLFTAGKQPGTGIATVTVAHESLLRVWPRASRWIETNKEFLRVRSRIDSRMKEGSLLIDGDPLLVNALEHISKNPKGFSKPQKEFIEKSAYAARTQRMRRKILIGSLIGISMIAIFGTTIYLSKQREQDALARQFAAQAERNLNLKDFARAEMAAVESLRYRDSMEGRELLLRARSGAVRFVRHVSHANGKPLLSYFSRDGEVAAYLVDEGGGHGIGVFIEATATGEILGRIDFKQWNGIPDCICVSHNQSPNPNSKEPVGSRTIAIAKPDHSVAIWKLENNVVSEVPIELMMLKNPELGRHKKRVPSLAFHPKESWLATCGEDQKLCLWDISTPAPTLIWEQIPDKNLDIKTHSTAIHGIAFNADGSLLGSGGGDYAAKLWKTADMVTGYTKGSPYTPHVVNSFKTMMGHSDSVFVIAFSPDGTRLASAGYDRIIRIWNLTLEDESGQPPTVGTLSGHNGTVLELAFSEEGSILISGGKDMTVRLWDYLESRILVTLHPERGNIRSVACRGFGSNIYCGGEDGWNVWSAGSRKVASRLWTGAMVSTIAFDPKGRFVAAGGSGVVRIWDANHQPLIDLSTSNGKTVNAVAFSADGRWLAAGGEDATVHIWDVGNRWNKQVPFSPESLRHQGAIWGLCFDPLGRWLASGNTDSDKRLRLWSTYDWNLIKESQPQEHSVYTLAANSDGSRLVSGDSDGKVLLWNCDDAVLRIIQAESNVIEGEKNVWSVSICPDPLSILSGNSNGHVYRWTPDKDPGWWAKVPGEKISISEKDAVVNRTINSVSYSEKYQWVAAVGDGGSIELYDVHLNHLRSLPGHDGTIWSVAFDSQGTQLASGGGDKFLRIWNLDELNRILLTNRPWELFEETKAKTGMKIKGNVVGLEVSEP